MKLVASLPHSGENIPPEAKWLKELDEVTLMGDVDRYVDQLWEPHLLGAQVPFVKTEWHRYAADLNRFATDVDAESVVGSSIPPGTHPRGFHWVYSTKNEKILHQPLTSSEHEALVKRVYDPFHEAIRKMHSQAAPNILHLDLHSMPSLGTKQHRDPGEDRADIVVSDMKGTSSDKKWVDIVLQVFRKEGFSVALNWPYYGGRLTEQYGKPQLGVHVIQIELNRKLYMNELTKQKNENFDATKNRLVVCLQQILKQVVPLGQEVP